MNHLVIAIVLLSCWLPAAAIAAGTPYYTKPDATGLPPSGRILMYDPVTGTDKNITGQVLREQVAPTADETLTRIATPTDTPLSKQPVNTSQYKRVAEFKDSTGKITSYIQAGGTLVIGTPKMLEVTAVNPANASTGYAGRPIALSFNKSPLATSGTYFYVTGVTATPYDDSNNGTIIWIPAALYPNTAYTLNVLKNNLAALQTDGETQASCGSVMTDTGTSCTSTFTTGSLSVASVSPAIGASGVVGTAGSPLSLSITFALRPTITSNQFLVSGTRWTDTSTQVAIAETALTPTTTDNLTYTLAGSTYYTSLDATHLTTYTVTVLKTVGLVTCPSGFTDGGAHCTYTFTAATAS